MISRILCAVLALATAAPCLAETPPKASQTVSQTEVKQYSPSTTPNRTQPVVGFGKGTGFRNGYPNGSHYTCCGPGTQYLARDCCLHLDLSQGAGLWDPCNYVGCSSCRTSCGCW